MLFLAFDQLFQYSCVEYRCLKREISIFKFFIAIFKQFTINIAKKKVAKHEIIVKIIILLILL